MNLPFTPTNTFGCGLKYEHNLTSTIIGFIRLDFYYSGKIYASYDNALTQDSYDLVDIQFGIKKDWGEFIFWAKNLFDEEYITLAGDFGDIGDLGTFGPPVTYGTTIRLRY